MTEVYVYRTIHIYTCIHPYIHITCPALKQIELMAHFHILGVGEKFRYPIKCNKMYAAKVSKRNPDETAGLLSLLSDAVRSGRTPPPAMASEELMSAAQKSSAAAVGWHQLSLYFTNTSATLWINC